MYSRYMIVPRDGQGNESAASECPIAWLSRQLAWETRLKELREERDKLSPQASLSAEATSRPVEARFVAKKKWWRLTRRSRFAI